MRPEVTSSFLCSGLHQEKLKFFFAMDKRMEDVPRTVRLQQLQQQPVDVTGSQKGSPDGAKHDAPKQQRLEVVVSEAPSPAAGSSIAGAATPYASSVGSPAGGMPTPAGQQQQTPDTLPQPPCIMASPWLPTPPNACDKENMPPPFTPALRGWGVNTPLQQLDRQLALPVDTPLQLPASAYMTNHEVPAAPSPQLRLELAVKEFYSSFSDEEEVWAQQQQEEHEALEVPHQESEPQFEPAASGEAGARRAAADRQRQGPPAAVPITLEEGRIYFLYRPKVRTGRTEQHCSEGGLFHRSWCKPAEPSLVPFCFNHSPSTGRCSGAVCMLCSFLMLIGDALQIKIAPAA